MLAQPYGTPNEALAQVAEGMDVFDAADEKVGTVKQVYLGGEDLSETQLTPDSILYDVPDSLRGRLATAGFVEIATGFLQGNRYASGDQVLAVDDRGVRLNAAKDDLVKK